MRHILEGKQFADATLLEKIFQKASELEAAAKSGEMPKLLSGKIVATIFYEPSTRTRLSFESAAQRLGAGVISTENAKISSSDVKGESLEDTTRMLSAYADIIVMRHPDIGTAQRAAKVASVPVINGGDGSNEHPTQAIYDLWTIKKEVGRLENIKVIFGFDPKHSRSIKSLAKLLAIFPNNHFTFVFPAPLAPEKNFIEELRSHNIQVELRNELGDLSSIDVLYLNRLQEERFSDKTDFEKNRKVLRLETHHLKDSKAIVLDPLPRVDEIDTSIDTLPNAKYFIQAQNGLYIRAALYLYALGMEL